MLKGIIFSASLIVLGMSSSGCVALLAGAAGGAGTAAWLSGKLTQEIKQPYEKTVKASKDTLSSMQYEITKEIKKDTVAQLMGKYSDGKTIWVDVHKITENSTRIDVRVGMSSDKMAEQKILDKIVEKANSLF